MTGRAWALVWLMAFIAGCACLVTPAFGAERTAWARPGCAVGSPGPGAIGSGLLAGSAFAGQGLAATLSAGFAVDGSAFVKVLAGDLELTKIVHRSGAFTIRLRRGDDTVVIEAGADDVTVTRGERSIHFALGSAGEDEALAVRTVLAGSRSVRALRVLGAGLAPGAERSPGGLALVLTDAIVGVLDGDVAAVQRIAERLGRKRVSVRFVREEDGCYERWEREVMRAWNDYEECVAAYLGNTFWQDLCGYRWILWVESSWFSFLKCAGSPFYSIQ